MSGHQKLEVAQDVWPSTSLKILFYILLPIDFPGRLLVLSTLILTMLNVILGIGRHDDTMKIFFIRI